MKKNYKLTLTVQTPIHIGCGITYRRNEYILDIRGKTFSSVDFNKIIDWIAAQNNSRLADDFEIYMHDVNGDLAEFLNKIRMPHDIQESIKRYTLPCDNAMIELRNKKRDFHAFIRDAYDMPYVPGSSIKGALHTAILVGMLIDKNTEVKSKITGNKGQYTAVPIEQELLHKLNINKDKANALNSIMSGIYVSDSAPLANSDIIVTAPHDVFPDKADKSENPPLLMTESLKPGTKICCTLTVTDTAQQFIDIDKIRKYISDAFGFYKETFEKIFSTLKNVPCGYNLFLGGNVGYFPKNIVYPYYCDNFSGAVHEASKALNKPKNKNDERKYGISPHTLKCVKYRGVDRPVGICSLSCRELDR